MSRCFACVPPVSFASFGGICRLFAKCKGDCGIKTLALYFRVLHFFWDGHRYGGRIILHPYLFSRDRCRSSLSQPVYSISMTKKSNSPSLLARHFTVRNFVRRLDKFTA